jgi:hypothetical protein
MTACAQLSDAQFKLSNAPICGFKFGSIHELHGLVSTAWKLIVVYTCKPFGSFLIWAYFSAAD